jgi:hypothetical protein
MEDSLDEHRLTLNPIEYTMAAMNLAAHGISIFAMGLAGPWVAFEEVEGFLQPARVVAGDNFAELVGAEFIDPGKIASRRRTELDFSHAGRGAQR